MLSIEQSPIFEAAKKYYDPRLPYHNWDHVMQTVAASREIIQNCLAEGIKVRPYFVYHCDAFHDADYIKDHLSLGFSSKEALSVSIAEYEFRKFNFVESYIAEVKQGIMSTNQTAPFDTIEQKVIRASDLASMAGDYETFKRNNLLLKLETEMLTGNTFTLDEWKERTKNTINFYLSQNIHLTKKYSDKDGNSVFHTNTRKNLDKFLTS